MSTTTLVRGLRVAVTCPVADCEKVFSTDVAQPGEPEDADNFTEGIAFVQMRLGQHMWSAHKIDAEHEPDVTPEVTDIKMKKALQQEPRGRSRSPKGPGTTSRSSASLAAAAPTWKAGMRRVNMFTMEAQINLAALSTDRLQELSTAVQRELHGRYKGVLGP